MEEQQFPRDAFIQGFRDVESTEAGKDL